MDRPTVLVIDYEPRNLAATVEPLTAAGYHVEVARDGIAGLDAFRRLHPPVVFMEAMLPKKHAFEVCQEIRRAQGSKTKVFILGAPTIAQSQQMKAVRQYGADRFLPRPVDAETLVSLCSPVLPGPKAPQIPEIDLLQPIPVAPRPAGPDPDFLAELTAPTAATAPVAPSASRDLNTMSEDDIMAQLDALLPSVPPPAPASIPVTPRKAASAPVPRPPVAAAPAPAPKPIVRPAPPPSPVRAVMTPPVLVPSPAPEIRPSPADAAPTPVPRRSKLPMVLTACALVAAGVGSWMFLRPGSAPVHPVQTETFADLAPTSESTSESTSEPPAPSPVQTPEPTETAAAQTAPAPLHVAPAPPVVPTMAAPSKPASAVQTKLEPVAAEKTLPPPAPKVTTETAAVQPPESKPEPTAADTTAEAAPDASAAEVPLPLAPPRLEPLPVGSDAARPRIPAEVFESRAKWGSLVELKDADKPPVAISRTAPNYPMAARQMRREGEVELRLLIDAQGQVAAVEVLTGGRTDFASSAERAVRKWKYRPAMKDGVPVQVKIVEKVSFKL